MNTGDALRRRRDAADRSEPYDDEGHRDPLDALRDELADSILGAMDPRRWCCLALNAHQREFLGQRGYRCTEHSCAMDDFLNDEIGGRQS